MEENTDVPKITIDPVVKLWQCKGNADCLHDEGQWKTCYACNPPQPVEESQAPPAISKEEAGIIAGLEDVKAGRVRSLSDIKRDVSDRMAICPVCGTLKKLVGNGISPCPKCQPPSPLSIAADGLAKALRSVDPFSGGRDGDMCLWCRRDRPRDLTEWAERFDPDNHDADCELILVLAAFEKAKESR